MPRTIQQTVEFQGVSPSALFEVYVDARLHSAAIGAPVTMSRTVGERFTAFGENHVRGTNLLVVPDRTVVQSWRARVWQQDDHDSILVLQFTKVRGGGQIELYQAAVPDHAWDIINRGWHDTYWQPWRTFFRDRGGMRAVRHSDLRV